MKQVRLATARGRFPLLRNIKAPGLRTFAALRMTAWGVSALVVVAGVVWLTLPKPPLLDGIGFSRRVWDRDGHVLHVGLTADEKYRIWTPLREISPALISATVRFEDKYFSHHPGVNPVALLRSSLALIRSGHAHAGASTITMQLARLRFGLHTRSVGGKLRQIARALELERHYTKEEILEAYLNLAPYGRNIEGIGAASEIYFGKSAARLTAAEAAALCVIPQSPTRRALLVGRENPQQKAAQDRWSRRSAEQHRGAQSRSDFVAIARPRAGFSAPHFVRHVLGSNGAAREIRTTLDQTAQRLIEQRISGFIAEKRALGITNAAALLVDFRSMEVLSQVGSADFTNAAIHGQVDGTRRPRSPGSALKPFVYALALEQGRIHPLTLLKDAPRTFGGYNPENFDRDFAGPIRASDALARSRNVPAVTLASQLSHPTAYEWLRTAGVRLPRDESYYGLSLPLGGAEVTMEDLVRLYAALANHGLLQPLQRTLAESRSPRAQRVLSPEAAFLALDMLGGVPRPASFTTASPADRPVFWKTGTSHGFRDAWSVAVFDHYVLAVWVGNFSGKRNPAFIGRTAAAPLLFRMIDGLRADRAREAEPQLPLAGANLRRAQFCSVSGQTPTALCAHRTDSWFIPGISPISACEVHREVLVDASTGLRVAQDDGTRAVTRQVYEFWPSDLLMLFDRAGVPRRLPPPFAPDVTSEILAREGRVPRITSPASDMRVSQVNASSGVPLRAETETGVRRLYWFADKAFIGSCDATEVLTWNAAPGAYELTALDDHGRSGSRRVTLQ